MQQERMTEALVPSLREYTACYGLTSARADQMADGAIVMHPGPMNRGVEIASEVADRPNAVITEQVANGVAVRSAVLFHLLSATRTQSNQPSEQLLPPEQLLPSEHAASNPETVLPEELAPLRNPQ
jgi:aspartate carbamoyltransferase catalytic subunit